jgi:hypothetical protein
MVAEEIRKLQREHPFEPYRIHTSDGKALLVKHPDYLFVSPGNNVVYVFSDASIREVVAVPNITRVEHRVSEIAED